MAFMKPEYTNEAFVTYHNKVTGEDHTEPRQYLSLGPDCEAFELIEKQWWARLSAPGYLDCTDWSGPFKKLDEARKYITETYDVDPDTGDETEDES